MVQHYALDYIHVQASDVADSKFFDFVELPPSRVAEDGDPALEIRS